MSKNSKCSVYWEYYIDGEKKIYGYSSRDGLIKLVSLFTIIGEEHRDTALEFVREIKMPFLEKDGDIFITLDHAVLLLEKASAKSNEPAVKKCLSAFMSVKENLGGALFRKMQADLKS